MAQGKLLQLAQELEWLGCELEYYGQKHAVEGFPGRGTNWDQFMEKQRGVIVTADKIERELKTAVRFNPSAVAGVGVPIERELETISQFLEVVEDIKQTAVYGVKQLPTKVREFTKLVANYLEAAQLVRT